MCQWWVSFCRWVPFWASQNAVCNQSLVGKRLCVIFSIFIFSFFFFCFFLIHLRHMVLCEIFLTDGSSLWMSQDRYMIAYKKKKRYMIGWSEQWFFETVLTYLFLFIVSTRTRRTKECRKVNVLMLKLFVFDFMI